jgi:ProP effector
MSKGKRIARNAAVIALLVEAFPKSFALHRSRRRPLKIGVHADIALALTGVVTPKELNHALASYTTNRGYLRQLLTGAWRIDLYGRPAGVVTAEDERSAKVKLTQLAAREVRRKGVRQGASASPRKPAAPIAAAVPKRIGLADLRPSALSLSET